MPAVERAGLVLTDLEVWRLHDAETVKVWRKRCQADRPKGPSFFRVEVIMTCGNQCSMLLAMSLVVSGCGDPPREPMTAAPAQGRSPTSAEAPYNPRTETSLHGTVHEVTRMESTPTVTHVGLRTSSGATTDIHLGPSSWLATQALSIEVGDDIDVVGSLVTYGGSEVLVAREVQKDGRTLTLRDTQGVSSWSLGR
jgi:hypothetical protein